MRNNSLAWKIITPISGAVFGFVLGDITTQNYVIPLWADVPLLVASSLVIGYRLTVMYRALK